VEGGRKERERRIAEVLQNWWPRRPLLLFLVAMVGISTNHQSTPWLVSPVAMVAGSSKAMDGVPGRHGWCPHQPSSSDLIFTNE